MNETEKSRQSYQVKEKPAVLLLPFLCGLTNRTSVLFFTTHLDEISMKQSRDCYCLGSEEIGQSEAAKKKWTYRKTTLGLFPSMHRLIANFNVHMN